MIQGSEEWRLERCGKVTGSRVSDVMAKGKGGAEATTRRNYKIQLAIEKMTGCPVDTFSNHHMERGIEREESARMVYEFLKDVSVEQVGFVNHKTIENFGVSPDGLVEENGLIQIKCPTLPVHITTILAGKVPSEYISQMQAEMECTGRTWNDFVSYNPEAPLNLQLFIARLHRDEDRINELREEVIKFNAEVEAIVKKLEER